MKYQNAGEILPPELLDKLQDYVQGGYLYIPQRDEDRSTAPTGYQVELQKRNRHIYEKYLSGLSGSQLAALYHLSRSSIRRILQKERRYFEEMSTMVQQIIRHWGLSPCEIQQIYTSAWDIGGKYILKVYENPDMLKRNLLIQKALRERGIPAARVLPAKSGAEWVSEGEKQYILMEKLSGSPNISIHQTPALPRKMGRIIAQLHQAFLCCEKQISFWDNSLLGEINGWVRKQLSKDSWNLLDETTFQDTADKLSQNYDALPRQLIHRDVHFGNFLFNEAGNFSGYIDFDLTQRNIRIFDLAYFLMGLLSEKENGLDRESWLRILDEVLAGYQQLLPLHETEKRTLAPVMESIELLFAAYFLSIDDRICAEDSIRLFRFVEENETEIIRRCLSA